MSYGDQSVFGIRLTGRDIQYVASLYIISDFFQANTLTAINEDLGISPL